MALIIILALITFVALIVQTIAFNKLFNYVVKELEREPSAYLPRATVILPCKGLDPGFKDNLRRLLDQDYKKDGKSHFEVIFAVARESDPAYEAIREVMRDRPGVETKIVVAGSNPRRAQKVNNQLIALSNMSDASEVIVFVDSDVIARDDFLRSLVCRLDDVSVGVTTGYRFYIPLKGTPAAFLRSMWNRMTAWEMASEKYAFAWGGAMAVRREIFDRANVLASWDSSADDDLALTTAIKRLGLRVHFVPQCLVASDGDGTIAEIVEWTNRQLILTKVYYPELWWRAINRALILTFWLVAVSSSLIWAVAEGDKFSLMAAATGLTLLPVELFFLIKAQNLWRRVLMANQGDTSQARSSQESSRDFVMRQAFDKCLLKSALLLPVAHLVLPWMTLYSLLTNRIKWRGISYELKSPNEIVVV